MNLWKGTLCGLLCALTWTAATQDTNALRTQIGFFESRTNVVIIKGYGHLGTINFSGGELSLRYKETSDTSTGEKVYGLLFENEGTPSLQKALVDEDEVTSLLSAVNYLAKVNSAETSLPSFEASYTSKAGLRVIAHANRREGSIQNYLQFCDNPRIALTSTQMTELYNLIANGQKQLADLKSGR